MLLCGLQDVRPGAVVAASIAHPDSPGIELLKPGVTLDAKLLARLVKLGVRQIWLEDDATRDLDPGVLGKLTSARMAIFRQFRQDLRTISRTTVSSADIQSYRQSILSLVCALIGDGKYAGLADTLFGAGGMAGHATNVAYLSILTGLELAPYIIRERPKLGATHANDMGTLGLAGMLHDIGKTKGGKDAAGHHEVLGVPEGGLPEGYDLHTVQGYRLLRTARVSASVTQAALNHHQRFDGRGWPDMAVATQNRRSGTLSGRQIHIFTRIVAAANTLDNLFRTAEGDRLPPVAALHQFASDRFSGWFDPVVRRAVLRRVPPFAVGSEVTLSDGRRAVVVTPSLADPCRPTVRLLGPVDGPAPDGDTVFDLRANPGVSIAQYLGIDVSRWLYTAAAHDTPPEQAVNPAPSPAHPPRRKAA